MRLRFYIYISFGYYSTFKKGNGIKCGFIVSLRKIWGPWSVLSSGGLLLSDWTSCWLMTLDGGVGHSTDFRSLLACSKLVHFIKRQLRQRCFALLDVFFYMFFQKGFGSQSSHQEAPDISQGSLKGWWAETPYLPLLWMKGEWFVSSSADWSCLSKQQLNSRQ